MRVWVLFGTVLSPWRANRSGIASPSAYSLLPAFSTLLIQWQLGPGSELAHCWKSLLLTLPSRFGHATTSGFVPVGWSLQATVSPSAVSAVPTSKRVRFMHCLLESEPSEVKGWRQQRTRRIR